MYVILSVCSQFDLALENVDEVSAIAWDKTIGRLCIGHARSTEIAVIDFAGAPVPTLPIQ